MLKSSFFKALKMLKAQNVSELSYLLAQRIHSTPDSAYCVCVLHKQEALSLFNTLLTFKPDLKPRLLFLPDTETLPYDSVHTHPSIVSARTHTLRSLLTVANPIVITTKNALISRFPPKSYLEMQNFTCSVGQKINKTELQAQLISKGYRLEHCVEELGQIASRGAVLDLFPINSSHALRLEWFDDEIDSIRILDTQSQLSKERITHFEMPPAREWNACTLNKDTILKNIKSLLPDCAIDQEPLVKLLKGKDFPGLSHYLPLLHSHLDTLFDYLPPNTKLFLSKDWQEQYHSLSEFWQQRYEGGYQKRVLMPIETLVMSFCELQQAITQHTLKNYSYTRTHETNLTPCPDIRLSHSHTSGLNCLHELVSKNNKILFIMENKAKQHSLLQHLASHNIQATALEQAEKFYHTQTPTHSFCTAIGRLDHGFIDNNRNICFASESDILGRTPGNRPKRVKPHELDTYSQTPVTTNWDIGTRIVHRDYGIGSFQGVQTRCTQGVENDYLVLHYHSNDKLFVPLHQLSLLTRYVGPKGNNCALDALGSGNWEKKRKKALKAIEDLSAKLLKQHSLRNLNQAYAIPIAQNEYLQMCEDFPYETTKDQQKAIDDVLSDLQSNKGMDRLICGDVGFGKTEVALRAAFVCIMAGYQVAMIAPTTLLAKQHFETFEKRFASWPIKLLQLTSLQGKTKDEDLKGIRSGSIDCVISTHKLLQSHIQFKRLALLVVDEEHRFGVKHKEMIHHLKGQAHILSLSATPIPRTLNMAMVKLRDFSIIASPPKNRQTVHTQVHTYDVSIAKEALQRELLRGGQAYYMHNDITMLPKLQDDIQKWFPEASVGMVHGKLSKAEMNENMQKFYKNQHQILLCTTIIESGIDVANANTIVVHRADCLGLSQLHQLRGRVGRSDQAAYAYFFTPALELLSEEARARLKSIEKHQELGSGLHLALEDLEIRGAGELLGAQQSGSVESIGIELYSQCLQQSSKALPQGVMPQLETVEIQSSHTALIPSTYMPDPVERVHFYRALEQATNDQALTDIQHALEDRFGLLAKEVRHLVLEHSIRWRMQAKRIHKLRIQQHICTFKPHAPCSHPIKVRPNDAKLYKYSAAQDGTLILFLDKCYHHDPEQSSKTIVQFIDSIA